MKKILFAAASLPVLMASCTQDVIESEMNPGNTPNAKGFQLELNATKGDNAITRGYKTNSHSMVFEGTDQINMFWLNSEPGASKNYSQTFNSIFNIEKQEDDESSSFKSKSLVYGGYNVATFPGQYTTSTGDIVLTVSNVPGGIVNIPYMSNLINLNCTNNKQGDNQTTGNLQKGFNNKLSMPMKQTANFAELDIEFSKIATGIEGYDDGMKVEKITFVSDAAAFAEKAYIQTGDNGVTTDGKWSYTVREGDANVPKEVKPIVAETKTVPCATTDELVSTAVTVENNGNTSATTTGKAYLMSFPTDATTTTGSIIINTNMGIVTIETVIEGTGAEAVNKTPLFNSENKNVTVESVFDLLADYHKNTRENSKFKNEIVGKYVPRTLKVDMTTAVIDGSVVKSSADIVRYVNLYNKLGKKDNMTLVLHKDFSGLNAAALSKLNSNDQFKLDAAAVSSITLLGGGDVQNATPKAGKFANLANPFTFNLEGGKEWAMSQKIAVDAGLGVYKYNNLGTLTINAGDNNNALAYELTNAGTVKFSGDVELGKYTANNGSTTTIVASQNITFLSTTSLNGTVTVASDAQLLAADSANVKIGTTGVVNNSGFLAVQIGGSAGITNVGTINVVDNAATTLITNNAEGAALGTINLNARNNEVAVGEATTQGNIAILTSKLADAANYKAEAGDKMNKLIIDAGNITIAEDAAILYIEVKNNASIYNKNATALTINTLTVNKGKTLNIPTGQAIEVSTLTKINENAKIIVGGALNYGACTQTSQIYTTGAAATVAP